MSSDLPAPRVFSLRSLLAAAVLAVATFAAMTTATGTADARLSWCAGDPVVDINGETVNINVLVPFEKLDTLENPVDVVIHVPVGVPHAVIEMHTPYFEERVAFIEETGWSWQPGEPIPVEVEVFVRASERFPVRLEILHERAGGREQTHNRGGSSNRWFGASFVLGR